MIEKDYKLTDKDISDIVVKLLKKELKHTKYAVTDRYTNHFNIYEKFNLRNFNQLFHGRCVATYKLCTTTGQITVHMYTKEPFTTLSKVIKRVELKLMKLGLGAFKFNTTVIKEFQKYDIEKEVLSD